MKTTTKWLGAVLAISLSLSPLSRLSAEETIVPNFSNVDISSIIGVVSKMTNKNFLVDPRVKAKISLVSSAPVNGDELYEIFLSVLSINGFAAVPQGDIIKIIPEVNAKQLPIPNLGEDNSASDQIVTHIFRIRNVSAAQLVPVLRPMVAQQGHLAATTNNTLIISDTIANISRIDSLIRRIDVADNSEVEVVKLKHASANEMVRILTALQQQQQIPGEPSSVRFVADERTNSIMISGEAEARSRMRSLVYELDTPLESGGNTQVVYLRYAEATELAEILRGVSAGQSKVGVAGEGGEGAAPSSTGDNEVDIQADEKTNSLIITAPPDSMNNLLTVVRQLDIRRAQVLVEAIIADVSEETSKRLGLDLASYRGNNQPAIISNPSGILSSLVGAGSLDGIGSAIGTGITALGGTTDSAGNVNFGAVLQALASDDTTNILSTPSLMTLDNVEAEMIVGRNVPFITGSQNKDGGDAFQTIQRQDVGLTLKVKPQLNEGTTIKLEISQEVSDVENVSGAADIATSKRAIKTTVLVEDGQTLILGGLMQDKTTDGQSKVPGVGDVPLLGEAFKQKRSTSSKRSLMVFIRPLIVRDEKTGTDYSARKYEFMRAQQVVSRDQSYSLNRRAPIGLPRLPEIVIEYAPAGIESASSVLDSLEQ
ncbi:MAG: type II secretion system secretin GspD [Gammaproteobacteria bacterium]|nr:type II secretion system secretin GspD [Gammaproteobacteria bacterium]